MSRIDEYIRKLAKESPNIPDDQKQAIRERFIARQLKTDDSQKPHQYLCPACNMPTPKRSRYCCNCGQKVTLEKPVMACLD